MVSSSDSGESAKAPWSAAPEVLGLSASSSLDDAGDSGSGLSNLQQSAKKKLTLPCLHSLQHGNIQHDGITSKDANDSAGKSSGQYFGFVYPCGVDHLL